jgi:multiple antibiotic resistance protein
MKLYQLFNYFISLLVICSPLSALPYLLAHRRSPKEKRKIGLIAAIATGVILTVVTWIGPSLLEALGIRIPAFQCAGGIVVFLVALSMLNAQVSRMKQTSEDQQAVEEKESIAIVPLAIPLMAGPGAMSTVIAHASSFPDWTSQVYMTGIDLLVAAILGGILYSAHLIEKVLGPTGINVINRIGGLILAAMAMESFAQGMVGLFPRLTY